MCLGSGYQREGTPTKKLPMYKKRRPDFPRKIGTCFLESFVWLRRNAYRKNHSARRLLQLHKSLVSQCKTYTLCMYAKHVPQTITAITHPTWSESGTGSVSGSWLVGSWLVGEWGRSHRSLVLLGRRGMGPHLYAAREILLYADREPVWSRGGIGEWVLVGWVLVGR